MTDHLARIRAMTKQAMHRMFAAEKSGDSEKTDAAAKDYTALCAAEVAMKKEIPLPPMWGKMWGKMFYICPTCNHFAGEIDNPPFEHCRFYCRFCGQKLREDDK